MDDDFILGTWQPVLALWTVSPECIGLVSPFSIPKTMFPRHAITSLLWGSSKVSLQSVIKKGRFEIKVTHSELITDFVMLSLLLPDYLTDIAPVVILDDEYNSNIRLVFLCDDRPPEIIILWKSWNDLVTRWRQIAQLDRRQLSKRLRRAADVHVDLNLNDFEQMLSL